MNWQGNTDQVEISLLDLEQQVFGRLRPFADFLQVPE